MTRLERQRAQAKAQLEALDKRIGDQSDVLQDALKRIALLRARGKEEAEHALSVLEDELDGLEADAEQWVLVALGLVTFLQERSVVESPTPSRIIAGCERDHRQAPRNSSPLSQPISLQMERCSDVRDSRRPCNPISPIRRASLLPGPVQYAWHH
jgi:hypothetical protein